MNGQDYPFRRILIELGSSYHNEGMMHFLAELADALGLELSARYMVDPCVASAAALPSNREYRPLENAWRPLDQAELGQTLELLTAAAGRRLARIASAHGVRHSFEPRADTIPAGSPADRSHSVIAIGQRWDAPLPETALQTALEQATGVLILPRTAPPKQGAIVIAAEAEDAVLFRLGARLAERQHETLIALGASLKQSEHLSKTDNRPGFAAGMSTESGFGSLGKMHPRLVVARRSALKDTQLVALGAWRNVPVLVVDD